MQSVSKSYDQILLLYHLHHNALPFYSISVNSSLVFNLQDNAHITNSSARRFVTATSQDTLRSKLFRSYSLPLTNDSIQIWEACRATSATPTYFEPIKIGPHHEAFVDGSMVLNNPVREVWAEAQELFQLGSSPGNRLKCLISIGSGVGPTASMSRSPGLVDAIRQISTESEHVAESFLRSHRDLLVGRRYFRFNVDKGLEKVGLGDWGRQNTLVSSTRSYLLSARVYGEIQGCVLALSGTDS